MLNNFNKYDDELNAVILEYNSYVRDYNVYISSFPVNLIAKNNGYKLKEYFDFKYGEYNENPEEVEKRNKKWIETGRWN